MTDKQTYIFAIYDRRCVDIAAEVAEIYFAQGHFLEHSGAPELTPSPAIHSLCHVTIDLCRSAISTQRNSTAAVHYSALQYDAL